MSLSKPDLDADLARSLLIQKSLEELQDAFLLIHRLKDLAQPFASYMELKSQQVRSAFHADLGFGFDRQQALGVKVHQMLENLVVGRAGLLETPPQLDFDSRDHPPAELRINVIADRI